MTENCNTNRMPTIHISDIKSYCQAFLSGQEAKVEGLCGRILRGKQPADFATLTNDPQRKIVMLMGSDGLQLVLGKPGYEMLSSIGYTNEQVTHLTESGHVFKLAVFEQTSDFPPASWENVLKLTGAVYPGAETDLQAQLPQLKRMSFEEIQAISGYQYASVKDLADPRYMTYERYMQSDRGLATTRAFLYYTLQLRELYRGDGYTYLPDGRRGLSEYCTKNVPIEAFGRFELIELPPIYLP